MSDQPISPPPLTQTWVPDRKLLAGGAGAVLAWAIFAAASTWLHIDVGNLIQPYVTIIATFMGIVPPPSAQGFIAILIGMGIAYALPTRYKDIYKRLNDKVIALAVADPKSPTSLPGIITESQKIGGNAAQASAQGVAQAQDTKSATNQGKNEISGSAGLY